MDERKYVVVFISPRDTGRECVGTFSSIEGAQTFLKIIRATGDILRVYSPLESKKYNRPDLFKEKESDV